MSRASKSLSTEVPKRKPGRPAAADGAQISRNAILATGYALARTVPLQDLSIVMVAKEMGVTPALIHYYISGRESLTSGVMNLFYRDLVETWPEAVGRWDVDILEASSAVFRKYIERAGVVAYAVAHNRFRTFQIVQVGEQDYGVEALELFTERFMAANLPPKRTAIYAHLMMEFIISAAHNAINHRYPGEYQSFLQDRVSELDAERFPGIHFTRHGLDELDATAAFNEACRLTLLGMQGEQLSGTMEARNPIQLVRKGLSGSTPHKSDVAKSAGARKRKADPIRSRS